MHFFKKIVVIAFIVAILYVILGYHFIIMDKSVKMLKKSTFTLKYTIYSTKGKRVETILSIPQLWEDGIGDLLLQKRKISREKLELYRVKMEEGEEED
jgi:hypothetical protein